METPKIPEILARFRRVAVVGISANPSRPSHWIARYLLENGYEVTGVNPALPEVPGVPVVATLAEVPGGPEIVDVFRAPEAVPEIVEEIAKLGAKPSVFWLQPGAENAEAEASARELGMIVISGPCIFAEHRALGQRS
jgi:predicted CoA-binding protein